MGTICVVASSLDKCLDEARDQDGKHTVSRLSRDETMSQDTSLTTRLLTHSRTYFNHQFCRNCSTGVRVCDLRTLKYNNFALKKLTAAQLS